MKPVRVLLADDHKLVRAGFRAMLNNLANIEVVAETGDGMEALDLIQKHRPSMRQIVAPISTLLTKPIDECVLVETIRKAAVP